MGSSADLTRNRGEISLVTINGETGNDLGVDAIEKVVNATKETHNIMILDNVNFGLRGMKLPPASVSGMLSLPRFNRHG